MGRISVNAIKPGMVLAEEVKDRNGRKLLNAGISLSEKHLRILKIWGVTEATIEGVSRETLTEEQFAELDPEVLEQAEEYVKSRFIHTDEELEPVRELMRFCTLRKAREAQRHAGQIVKPSLLVAPPPKGKGPLPELPTIDPQGMLQDDMKLGSLPIIFHRLVDVVNDSRSSAMDVAEVIGNDTDLSARLLRVVNSAFYGLSSKVDTISRAVAILGSNQLVSLAMGISVITYFKGIPNDLINMYAFWRHSLACGIAARILASYHKTPNTERFFVAGLLHDIGRLVIFKVAPQHGKQALELSQRHDCLLVEAEQEVLGFTHDKVGGLLLKKWKFPVSLEKNVRYHHLVHKAPNKLEAAIIQVADVLANALEQGTSGERLVPPLSAETWEIVGIPISALTQTAMQMDYQTDEIVHFFTQDE